jgi:hypothetical protein
MRLLRFRVRDLLIVILLTGVAAWGCVMWGRSTQFGHRADHYRMLEEQADQVLDDLREGGFPALPGSSQADVSPDASEAELKRVEAMREDFRRARLKYERAERSPWLAPPEPY